MSDPAEVTVSVRVTEDDPLTFFFDRELKGGDYRIDVPVALWERYQAALSAFRSVERELLDLAEAAGIET